MKTALLALLGGLLLVPIVAAAEPDPRPPPGFSGNLDLAVEFAPVEIAFVAIEDLGKSIVIAAFSVATATIAPVTFSDVRVAPYFETATRRDKLRQSRATARKEASRAAFDPG